MARCLAPDPQALRGFCNPQPLRGQQHDDLPPYSSELNPVENIGQFLRQCGGTLASASLLPGYWRQLFEDARFGRLDQAIGAQRRLLPLLEALFAETNPGPLKEALAMIGLSSGHALPPLRVPSDAVLNRLRAALDLLLRDGVIQRFA